MTGVFSQVGRRVISFFLPAGPTRAVLSAYASEGSRGGSLLGETKSEKEGPVFNLSAKTVEGRDRDCFDEGSVDSGAAVAKVRERMNELGRDRN